MSQVTIGNVTVAEDNDDFIDVVHTVVAGDILFVGVVLRTDLRDVLSVTWDQGGLDETALTLFNQFIPTHGSAQIEVWALGTPTAKTATVRVVLTGNQKMGVICVSAANADSTTPLSAVAEDEQNATTGSVSVTQGDNDLAFVFAGIKNNGLGVFIPGGGEVTHADFDNLSSLRVWAASEDGTGATTLSWTISVGSGDNATVGFLINESAFDVISKTSVIPVEHLSGLQIDEVLGAEHLLFLERSNVLEAEHLLNVPTSQSLETEHLAELEKSVVLFAEHRGLLDKAQILEAEHLRSFALDVLLNAEHLRQLEATKDLPSENRFGMQVSVILHTEHLRMIQQGKILHSETLRRLTDSKILEAEHLRRLEAAKLLPTEHQLSLQVLRTLHTEHLRDLNTSRLLATENLLRLARDVDLPAEHLRGIESVVLLNAEFRALVFSEQVLHVEHLQILAAVEILPFEIFNGPFPVAAPFEAQWVITEISGKWVN